MIDNDFAKLLTAMRETMYRISYAQLSRACDRDDAVQETLLKAWDKRHKLKDERYAKTWVIRILINECHNIQRKQKRDSVENLPKQSESAESIVALRDALFRLDKKLRLPVVLHYIEGYQVREIAKILAIPRGTVLWRMSKARKMLSAMLDTDSKVVSVIASQQKG